MRRITLILLLLGMFFVVGIVGAQEAETVLYILHSCDCDGDTFFDEIVEELGKSLSEYNISIHTSSTNEEPQFYRDLPISFYITTGSDYNESPEGDVNFTEYQFFYRADSAAINKQLAALSPLLDGQVDYFYSIPVDSCAPSQGHCEYFIDILTIMSLYSLDLCDLAENRIATIQANQLESYILIKTLQSNCDILQGDYLGAETALEGIGWESLNYPDYLISSLAWLYIQNDKASSAIEILQSYVESRRENLAEFDFMWLDLITALKNRAQIYALAFDYDSAIADMDEAIALAEENAVDNTSLAELYTIRGQIVFLLYEWDRVLENFNHAIELDPNYAPAYFQRGVLYYTMTQRENALADFDYYLELEPDGLYAEEATQYIESIRIELEALGG